MVRVWFCNRRQKEKRIFCPIASLPVKSHSYNSRMVSCRVHYFLCNTESLRRVKAGTVLCDIFKGSACRFSTPGVDYQVGNTDYSSLKPKPLATH